MSVILLSTWLVVLVAACGISGFFLKKLDLY